MNQKVGARESQFVAGKEQGMIFKKHLLVVAFVDL